MSKIKAAAYKAYKVFTYNVLNIVLICGLVRPGLAMEPFTKYARSKVGRGGLQKACKSVRGGVRQKHAHTFKKKLIKLFC